MLKRMIGPFLICLILSGALGLSLYLLAVYNFFDFYTRLIVLACIFLLLFAVWAAFVAEWRETSQLLKAHRQEALLRDQQNRQLEEQALRDAAAILSGKGSSGEGPAS